MTLEHYQSQTGIWLAKMRRLTERCLEDTGETSDDCQKLAIIQAINTLQDNINGVTTSDIKVIAPKKR